MAKTIQTVSMVDILPPNLKKDENVYAIAKVLDEELHLAADSTKEVIHIARMDELPENVLDLLAWQFHVDRYEPVDLDIETKRNVIKESIALHRIKGTPKAVEMAVAAYFDHAKVREWYDYGGEPYHFRVGEITSSVAGDETIKDVVAVIMEAKNVRSWLDEIGFSSDLPPGEKNEETGEYENTSFLLAFATDESDAIDFYPGIELDLDVRGTEYYGAAYLIPLMFGVTYGIVPEITTVTATVHPEIAMAWKEDIDLYPEQEAV